MKPLNLMTLAELNEALNSLTAELPAIAGGDFSDDDIVLIKDVQTNQPKNVSFTQIAAKMATINPAPSVSTKVASLSGINLKTPAANTLVWETGKSAVNTANYRAVVKWVSGTYQDNSVAEVLGTGEVSIDGDATNGAGGGGFVSLQVDGVQISSVSFFPAQVKTKAQVIAGLIANAQNGWGIANLAGDVLTLTEPIGEGGVYDGLAITIVLNLGEPVVMVYTVITPTITGGTSAVASTTDFDLKLNGENMKLLLANIITLFDSGAIPNATHKMNMFLTDGSGTGLPIFPVSGDFALPVTVGALNDFVIDVEIHADTI